MTFVQQILDIGTTKFTKHLVSNCINTNVRANVIKHVVCFRFDAMPFSMPGWTMLLIEVRVQITFRVN